MSQNLIVEPLKNLSLKKVPTRIENLYSSDDDYEEKLREDHKILSEQQERLYAQHSQAVLVVFQGMDTSGKDGAIKHVMSGLNPQGCWVVSFKAPSQLELDHDFFWRVNRMLPARGMIGVFNRSYYEEVLITRVHPEILESERLPRLEIDEDFWEHRYRDIVHHEKYLHRQGYEIIKIFLHISKDEQRERLSDRFKDPGKHWKISESDIRERKFWDEYQKAYEKALSQTSSKHCPWYLVPADDKKNARLLVSTILIERMKAMKLSYPKLKPEQEKTLSKLRKMLK